MKHHSKTSWFFRSFGALALPLAILASGCLPEYEELPLTATGEGGESLTGTTSSGSTSSVAPTCSGTASGSIPGTPSLDGQIPCTLQGSIDARNLTPSQRTQVAGIKVLKGTLTVASAEQIGYLKALTSVDNLYIPNFSGPALELPARIGVTTEVLIQGGNTPIIKGFAGVTALAGQLDIEGINGLTTIDAFAALTKAEMLRLYKLPELTSVKGFGAVSQLKGLQLTHLAKLKTLPPMPKVTTLSSLVIGYNPELMALSGLNALTNAATAQFASLDKVSQVSFPALMTVSSFVIDGMALLNDLEGFGAQLVVSSQLQICNILMKADQREVWRLKHAPNVPFAKCANGCIGMGC